MAEPEHMDDSPMRVVELAANLDDVTGEQVGAVIDRLIAAGALDAWATPITMKKGRPAITLSVLAREEQQDALARQLLADTGSFGLRIRSWDRIVLNRTYHQRDTPLGKLCLKAGSLDGQPVTVKPEFDDVLASASATGTPLSQARRIASVAADALLNELKQEADHA